MTPSDVRDLVNMQRGMQNVQKMGGQPTVDQNARPDEIVFAQYQRPSNKGDRPLPQIVYYAHRNIAVWTDESYAHDLSRMNGVSKMVVFVINPDETAVEGMRRMSF